MGSIEYTVTLVGFSDSANSSRAATAGSTASNLGSGYTATATNGTYTSYSETAESDSDGNVTFTSPVAGTPNTITVFASDGTTVTATVTPKNSGENAGTITLVESGRYSLKVTGEITTDTSYADGYLYAGSTYDMTVTVANTTDVVARPGDITIAATDSNLTVSGDTQGHFASFKSPSTKTFSVSVNCGPLSIPYLDTGLNVTFEDADGYVWTDFIPLRFFKETESIIFYAEGVENDDCSLNGFVMYPDGNSQYFSVASGKFGKVNVPSFPATEPYKLAFSGAILGETVQQSTEMKYSVGVNVTPVSDFSGYKLSEFVNYCEPNDTEDVAVEVETSNAIVAYLETDDIDFYSVAVNSYGANTTYKVNHYLEDADCATGNETFILDKTEICTGTVGYSTSATAKSYDGFTAKSFSQKTVADGGNTEVDIFYMRNTVTVTLNANGGTFSDGSTVKTLSGKYGCTIDTSGIENPTYTGYEFSSWQNMPFVFSLEDTTYYAVWGGAETSYTIKHYKQPTSLSENYELAETETLSGVTGAATTASAKSYTGFTAKSFEQGTVANDGSTVISIYYDRNTYTIIFDANGGIGTMSSITVAYGVSVTLTANAFTKTGYSFAGWSVAESVEITTAAYTDGGTLIVSASVTLYAVWTANTYTIAFDANGGSGTMSSMTATYGVSATLSINAFTKIGYHFSGWSVVETVETTSVAYTDGVSVSNLTTVNGGSVILYAVWTINTYTISYDANGGSGEMESITMTYGDSVTLTANTFTRTGYTFAGWATSSTASTATYTDGESVSNLTATNGATVTLYAVWEGNTYTIEFDANGGSGTMFSMTATYGVSTTLSSNAFTKTGYHFTGWSVVEPVENTTATYTNGESVSNLTSTNGATVTLYAVWSINTYTIVYNANGGGGTMSSINVTYGESASLTLNTFTRTGYHFIGWSPLSSASAITYKDGASVKNLSSTNGATITLYAVWKANTYTIVFDANGGSGTMESITATYNTNTTLSFNSFAKDDYTFTGWATSSDAASATYSDGATVKNLATTNGTTVTLYAVWTVNTYTIAFNANDGNGSMSSITATYGTSTILTANVFSRTGYTFAGWSKSSSASTATYTDGATVKNLTTTNGVTVTLYAVWKANTYTIQFDSNGGSGTMSAIIATYDESITLGANTFEQSDYPFAGWTLSSDSAVPTYTDGATVKNLTSTNNATVTLYAVWGIDTSIAVSYIENLTEDTTIKLTGTLDEDTLTSIADSIKDSSYKISLDLSETTGLTKLTNTDTGIFAKNSNLVEIILPSTLTNIPSYCFSECANLKSITIPASVITITTAAFYNCSTIESVYISSLENWCEIYFSSMTANPLYKGANLYIGDELATDLEFPSSVTSIGPYQFYGCSSISSAIIGCNVTSIGSSAFCSCTNLTNVTISASVTFIGYSAFNSTGLANVIFEITSGWEYSSTSGSDEISSSDLANTTTAATYLKTTYRKYKWRRS